MMNKSRETIKNSDEQCETICSSTEEGEAYPINPIPLLNLIQIMIKQTE